MKLEVKRVRRDVGVDDSGSDDEDAEALQDGRSGGETNKEIAEEAKASEISIPLLNRASGWVCRSLQRF